MAAQRLKQLLANRLIGRLIGAVLVWASAPGAVCAGEVEILMVDFGRQGNAWEVSVTLRHDDRGWAHYADAWRVVSEEGRALGTRTLYHPHDDEQPFTRSLGGLVIPADLREVYVEAHDNVHGWSRQRVRVDLSRTSGERYRVRR